MMHYFLLVPINELSYNCFVSYTMSPSAPIPTPNVHLVPNGPVSNYFNGPLGLQIYTAVAVKLPPSTVVIESLFIYFQFNASRKYDGVNDFNSFRFDV